MERVDSTTQTVVIYGTFVPVRESRLSFERGGKVQEVRKAAGDRVAEGDTIAFLESGELDKQRQQLRTSLEQAKQRLRSATPETAPPFQQQIGQLDEQLSGVEAELKRRVIVAPFNGLVSEMKVREGEIAAPSTPVVVVVTDEPPQVAVSLAEKMALRVLAQKTVRVGLGDRAVEFNVMSSSERFGPTRGTKIVFGIQETLPDDSWSYGEDVELRFREPVSASGCWLPLSALQKGTGEHWHVFVVAPTADATGKQAFRVERYPVAIRLLQNHLAFVESSLTVGEFVIVDGTHRVVAGQDVTPVTIVGQSIEPTQQGAAN